MRKVLQLLLVVTLAAAACGDDDGSASDPAAADSCEELADIGIDLMQEAVDEIDKMDLAEFMELASSEELPPELARFEEVGDALEARAGEIGCSEEEGQRLMCERIDRLSASGEVGKLVVAGLAEDC